MATPKKMETIGLRVEAEMKEKLQQLADERGVTLSNFIQNELKQIIKTADGNLPKTQKTAK